MTTFWTWLYIIGLSMTPGLILGPSAAIGVGYEAHYSPWILLPVVAAANYFEGLVFTWLMRKGTQIGFIHRWVERIRTPKAIGFAKNWGVWGGLTIGRAVVGQEPILAGLELLGIDMRRIYFPLAISSIIFTLIYYAVVSFGLDQVTNL
jgi:hypothetical protein